MDKIAKFICVTEKNNNKYYDMKLEGSTIFVEYGRVGGTKQTASYPSSKWQSLYNSKTKKGYQDVTNLRVVKEMKNNFSNITDNQVADLISILESYSKKSIQKNYTVTSEAVTEAMVDEAQKLVDEIAKLIKVGQKAETLNSKLLKLYTVIPRKMDKVQNHLFNDIVSKYDFEKAEKKIEEEQATLDVMAQQVEQNKLNAKAGQAAEENKPIDILTAMGLDISLVTDKKVIDQIKKLMADNSTKFKRAFAVVNKKTQKKFNDYVSKCSNKKIELFWHGSRNENWLSIMEMGLVLRPANAVVSGKMYGYGTYGANVCQKSLNYTSLRGSYWARGSENRAFLALYDFHVGKQFVIKNHGSWCYSLDEKALKDKGNYDSVYAPKGADLRNDEFIVYNESQTNIRYIIEVGV